MSESHKAVFISYASQDAEAARRICEALRSAGIEVWFDQSELRGGDAWDQKIRKQIKECALFVPVVSAETQARREGYFRREWNLACDRLLDMTRGTAFLLPIVIDGTREGDALVPDEFRAVQWSRLPDSAAVGKFSNRVRQLLGDASSVPDSPVARRHQVVVARRSDRRHWAWLAGTAAVVGIGVAYVGLVRRSATSPLLGPVSGVPVAGATTAIAPAEAEKSIAVLPFTNLSPDPANAFFADGVHEDVLTNLSLIRDLRVVSRTSVMAYRDSKKNMRQIAAELGVTHLLEGSVRRAGDKIRVTGQLIRAADDAHLWAKSFDRDLTDMFALQSALAGEIAGALQSALSPETRKLLARKLTDNPAAYDLYLKARDTLGQFGGRRAETLLAAAVQLDPNFAAGWAALAAAHSEIYYQGGDGSAARRAKAKAAIERAIALAPESPEVLLGWGLYHYYADWNYDRAAELFEKLRELSPHDPAGYQRFGNLKRKQGRWVEAIAENRKAAQVDPADPRSAQALGTTLLRCRQFDGALAERRRLIALRPGIMTEFDAAYIAFVARGSRREVEEFLRRLSPEQANSYVGQNVRRLWAAASGDFEEARRLDASQPSEPGEDNERPRLDRAIEAAAVAMALGDVEGARRRVRDLVPGVRSRLQAEPENPYLWYALGLMEAMLGQPESAVAAARKGVELRADDHQGTPLDEKFAIVLAWSGDKDGAIAELKRRLSLPGHTNVHELRHGPWFVSLRGDPRFEALLNDPKNNEPLF